MDNWYSLDEKTNTLLVLSFCEGNCRKSVGVYREIFPSRSTPKLQTFKNVEYSLRETCQLKVKSVNAGRPRQAWTVEGRNSGHNGRNPDNQCQSNREAAENYFHTGIVFTRRGKTNLYNEYVYGDENAYTVKKRNFQHKFSVHVWMGLINKFFS